MSLEITEFEKALNSLKEALDFAEKISDDNVQFKIARDACLQRFEYSIELSWKISVKKLGSTTKFAKPAIREMARADLISNPESWLGYIDARNSSSHSYDEKVAERIYVEIKKFYLDAISLLGHLKKL